MNSLYNHPQIHIKDRKTFEEKIRNFKLNKLQIVADFDNTITQDNGETSWSLFPKSGLMPDEYVAEEAALFDHYYPLEIDVNLKHKDKDALMKEWWLAALELFVKYKLHIDIIDEIIEDECAVDFRDGMKEFLELTAIKNIPFIILSAGLTNSINEFLSYTDTQFSNIHVVSNELKFDEDGYCIGINKDIIIHSENKDEHDMPEVVQKMIEGKTDIILLGDSLNDVKMIDENLRAGALKIGFLAEKKKASKDKFMEFFDIVIEDNYDSFGVPEMILEMIK